MYSLADTILWTSLTTPSALDLTLRLPAMFSWQPIPGENWLMTHRHSQMLTCSMLLLFREWHKWVILYILGCSSLTLFSVYHVLHLLYIHVWKVPYLLKSSPTITPNNPVLVTISLLFYIAGKNLILYFFFLSCLFVCTGLKKNIEKKQIGLFNSTSFSGIDCTQRKLANLDEGNWMKAWEICIMSCSLEHSSCSSRMGRAWRPM